MHIVSMVLAVISLITASVEDIRTKSVTNAVWWIFSAGLPLLLFFESGIGPDRIAECVLVIAVQEFVMSRAYGRADSHAFSCCAVFLILSGSGLEGHILHMSLSLVILTVVQMLRGNVDRNLKLKTPVPFIPYISVSFALALIIL